MYSCSSIGLKIPCFSRQIDRDCEFLEAERIMDYSLLVGVHFRDDASASKMGLSRFNVSPSKLAHISVF